MDAAALERYLHTHMPLAQAMGVGVVSAAPGGVVLCAPLAPNINHQATLFGGSASAIAILAAWSQLHVLLQAHGVAAGLVIQRNHMDYLHPVTGDFTARAMPPEPAAWDTFVRTLGRRGRARIAVAAVLEHAGVQAGRLSGEFVALREDRHAA